MTQVVHFIGSLKDWIKFKLEAHDMAMLLEMTMLNAVLPFTARPHVSFHKPNAGI